MGQDQEPAPIRRRGRPRRLTVEAAAEAVLDAATHHFALHGPDGATLEDIAKEAGIAKAALYEHFPSKKDLFEAAALRALDRFLQHMDANREASRTLPALPRTEARFAAVLRHAEAEPDGFTLLLAIRGMRAQRLGARVAHERRRVTDRLAGDIAREFEGLGLPHGQVADILATAFFGMAEGVARRHLDEPTWSADAVAELLAAVLMVGLGGAGAERLRAADEPVSRPDRGVPRTAAG